jgi:hypothetical protein
MRTRRRIYATKPGLTEAGEWLDATITRLWGARLPFLEQTRSVAEKTLDALLYRSDYHPSAATLGRLHDAIARAQRARGEIPVEARDVLARWTTQDQARDARVAAGPQCPICGRPPLWGKITCSPLHRTLYAFLAPRLRLRTVGGRQLWAVCAASADVPPDRIARLLEVPLETVRGWLGSQGVDQLLAEIRQARARPGETDSLLRPVAGLFTIVYGGRPVPMATDTLHRYLTGGQLRHARYGPALAERLGMTAAECAPAFEVDLFAPYARERIRRLQPQRYYPQGGRGRPAISHALVRRIHKLRVLGRTDTEISRLLAASGEVTLSPGQIYWVSIRHVRGCRSSVCLWRVASDLRARGKSARAIARILQKPRANVLEALALADRRVPVFAYGRLRVTQAAERLQIGPAGVRYRTNQGQIDAGRTRGGWRRFDVAALRDTPQGPRSGRRRAPHME